MWHVATTDAFDEWFTELEEAAQVEVIAKVELLKTFGPALSRPHADTLKNSRFANMKELRATTGRAVLRVAFAFDPARQAILLVGGNKGGVQERQFYRALIEKADRLFAEHLDQLESRRKKETE